MTNGWSPEDIGKAIEKALSEGYKHPKLAEAITGTRFIKVNVDGKTLIWIFMGRREDHIIIPRTYCSCKDFIIHVLSQRRKLFCYHLVGQVIAEREKKYREVNVDLKTCSIIVDEILDKGISVTLRRILLKS